MKHTHEPQDDGRCIRIGVFPELYRLRADIMLKLLEAKAGDHRRGSATIAGTIFSSLLLTSWQIPSFHLMTMMQGARQFPNPEKSMEQCVCRQNEESQRGSI